MRGNIVMRVAFGPLKKWFFWLRGTQHWCGVVWCGERIWWFFSEWVALLFPHQLINICTAKGKVYYRCWRGQCKGPRLLSLKTPSCIVWNWGGHILAWSNGHALSYHTANLRIPKYKRKTKTDNQLSFTGWEWVWRLHWFSLFELWTRKTLSCNISQGG